MSAAELPRSFGTYTLLKLLARGGMGEIYLARTAGITGFEKYYAVKKLLKKFTHDNDVGARFIDEAKLGARLQHPNIVQVYDLGRVTDELYMATEFVDGFDLRRVLRFCHEKKKRIPLDIALFIVREILSGLAYAHRQVDAEGHSINLIHRDISPQNVLVSFEGEVKIIDFGLAKSTQRSQETQANVLLGNFGYMSPEQARGHALDVRTDVYSAGIVLFELVTGTKRFVEENPLRLLEMVARPTPIVPSDRVPGTPKTIDKIYSKATAAAKEERFEHAESFRDDITTALHRINPKASRENLAQFLNHLFLGGAAPALVDADSLDDKSVAVRARDLHETSDAFHAPAESDISDRRLHEFSDDAPATGSHPLMRQARAGDTLTHQQLTGEDLTLSGASTMQLPPDRGRPGPARVAPAFADDAEATFDAGFASAASPAAASGPSAPQPTPSTAPAFTAIASPAIVDVDVDDEVLDDIVGDLTAEIADEIADEVSDDISDDIADDISDDISDDIDVSLNATVAHPPVAAPSGLVVDLGPPMTPTSIYDSPAWAGQLDRAAAASEPASTDAARPDQSASVQAQIEAQAAQADLQRQLEMQVEMQHQLEQQAQTQRQAAQQAEKAKAAQLAQAAEKPALPKPPSSPPTRAPPPEQSGVHRAPQIPPSSRGNTTVVTTVGPPPKRPTFSQEASPQPSIVISMDLEPGEPTVVGAANPTASRSDVARTIEVKPVSPVRSGGFSDGGVHESLIIDFDGEAAELLQEPEPAKDGEDKNIRPAAQPLGKRVVPAVAQPKVRPSATGRPATSLADESPTSMPPPTRRRP